MPRRVPLVRVLAARHPDLQADEIEALVTSGAVLVDGAVVTNVRANIDPGCSLVLSPIDRPLKGERKLGAALDECADIVTVDGAVALDVGACTGGFTSALLSRGARRVYAVDVGSGQLLGRLRQDVRVVNLEATNASSLTPAVLRTGDTVGLITIDVSYTPLATVVPQVSEGMSPSLATDAVLIALVKPMFELQLGRLPTEDSQIAEAVDRAVAGVSAAGWSVVRTFASALLGNRGAVEWWVVATW